jgi:hypothetical protein
MPLSCNHLLLDKICVYGAAYGKNTWLSTCPDMKLYEFSLVVDNAVSFIHDMILICVFPRCKITGGVRASSFASINMVF